MNHRFSFLLIAFALLGACKGQTNGKPAPGKVVIAEVMGTYLYLSDLPSLSDPDLSGADSINYLTAVRDAWIKEQLAVQTARNNLSSADRDEIRKRIQKLEDEMFIYEYEMNYIRQKFDTSRLNVEMRKFYEEHAGDYILELPILRFIMLSDNGRVRLDSLKTWVGNEAAMYKFEDLCSEQLLDCHLERNTWVDLELLLEKLGMNEQDFRKEAKEGAWSNLSGSHGKFHIYLIEQRAPGDTIPLAYIRNDIRTLVINKEKSEFIKQLRNELYDNALQTGKVKIY